MYNDKEIKKILRIACKDAGSPSAWAKQNGISRAYVLDALKGRRSIGEKIGNALGYTKFPPEDVPHWIEID